MSACARGAWGQCHFRQTVRHLAWGQVFQYILSLSIHVVIPLARCTLGGVPRLWTETIETHRREVRDAILDATWQLVTERGLLSVTMSHVAKKVGIGRATLYKYFPDVESILITQHERHVSAHLAQLARARAEQTDPQARLKAVLDGYALICYRRKQHGPTDLSALLHRDENVASVQQQLIDLIEGLLSDAAATGLVRADVDPRELATYCVHALNAAADLPSVASVRRLVFVTMDGLRPPA